VYWPAVHGGILWDDPAHITRLGLRGAEGLWRIWFEIRATQEYYPVLHSAFWLEYLLWGESTTGYHVLNIALHAANACLLAVVLRRLWTVAPAEQNAGVSEPRIVPPHTEWLAAALFAVHPVCVESVAWITEQKNTLSTLFYLLAAWRYLDFAVSRKRWTYAAALIFFLLALGAKTMTVTLPAALLVVIWWKQRGLVWRRDVWPLLPWFGAAVFAGLVTSWVESDFVGADLVVPDLSLWERTLLAARIFWFSLGQLLWPASITFFYPLWDVSKEAQGWILHLSAGVLVTLVLWALRRRFRGALAAWLLYAGTLFPVLGFFKVFAFSFSYVADHFQYLAIPIVMAAAAAGLSLGFGRLPSLPRLTAPALGFAVVITLAVIARQLSALYQDDETLFRANISVNPNSWMGHHVLATTLARVPDRRDEAIALYRRALQLKPANPDSLSALALLLVEQPGNREEAIGYFREAIRLRPTFAEAHNGLANELAANPATLEAAVTHYQTALRLRPRFILARANLAQTLARLPGREEEALQQFTEVLQLMPDHGPSHFHKASLLASIPSRRAEAIPHYESAIQLRPDAPEAHAGLGHVLMQLGRATEAVRHYEKARQLNPDSAEYHAYLGNALAAVPGQLDDAFKSYESALRLDPQLASVHFAMAVHLMGTPERLQEALAHAENAVRIRPDYVEAHNVLGVVHARLGQKEAARACWNRALEIAPDFAPARKNLNLL
jgi:tetratricopeptide (TPR) repeat protein